MVDPTTANVLLAVPTHGSDVGTWDAPMNANYNASDGFFGGAQTISVSASPVTLTAPAGTVTAGAGPFQSQNRILKFTGTLTNNVQVTLPLPCEYTLQNLTTGNFNLTFIAAGAGKIVSIPQGSIMHVWNDGTDCWLHKNTVPGQLIFLGGVTATPGWITACSVPPFLINDGSVYNISTYPALGALYGANFGGNGSTTFGVQDLRGRVPLAYDGTGTRITAGGGAGFNGQTMGASGGNQGTTLITANLPPYTPAGTVNVTNNASSQSANAEASAAFGTCLGTYSAATITATFSGTAQGGTSTVFSNVPPTQVAGIWLVAT